jgi:hypothetical protein
MSVRQAQDRQKEAKKISLELFAVDVENPPRAPISL